MAVYHFQEGGTKTGAAGASTPGNWELSNCYGVNENRWNDVIAQVDDGDEIVFYDDGITPITYNFGTPNNANAAADGEITIRSRSSDPAFCLWTSDGTGPIFDCTEAVRQQGYIIQGINPLVTSYSSAFTPFRFLSATQNVEFRDCLLGPFGYTGSGSGFGGGIVINNSVNNELRFYDTKIIGVNGEFNDSMIVRHSGTSGTVVITGGVGLEIKDSTISDVAGQFDGSIYLPSGAALASASRIYAEDVTVTCTTANHRCMGVVHSESGAVNFDYLRGKNVNLESKTGGGILLAADGVDVNAGTVLAEDCEMVTDGSENDPGGVVFAFNSATLDVEKIDARRCYAPFGTALYWGSGAGGTIGRIIAIDNDVRESSAAVYNGGFADQTIGSLLAVRCGHRGTQFSSDAHPSVMLTRLSTIGATGDKTVNIGQVTIVDCTSQNAGDPMVRINSSNTTHALNVNCYNWLMDNEAGKDEIQYAEDHASAELNLVINTIKLPNGASDIVEDATATVVNGSVTTTNVLTGSTSLASDFAAPTEADAIDGGYLWSPTAQRIGADGEPFPQWDITLGAVQSKAVPFHPSQR